MINIYKTKAIKKHLYNDTYNPHFNNHHMEVNKHILVVGATGTGKSNFVLNLINKMNNTFQHIFIYTKNTSEPLYEFLKDQLKNQCTLETIINVPSLNDIKKYSQSMIIFDDFIIEKKEILNKLEEYVIMSRKQNFTCVFLTQSFYPTSKIIRQNCSYLVLLSMTDKRNLGLIISTLAIHIEPLTIKHIISNATKNKLNVCIIDVHGTDLNYKFRRNFSEYYEIVNNENNEELSHIQLYKGNGMLN